MSTTCPSATRRNQQLPKGTPTRVAMMTKEVMVETMEGLLLHTPVIVLLMTMVDQTLPEMAMMPVAVAMIGEEAKDELMVVGLPSDHLENRR
jgi:hypothetical protein